MSLEALRALSRAHALVAWMATAALIAAATASALPRARRLLGALGAVAAALVASAGVLGALLHDGYRARLRQKLFVSSASLGWLFERKLHLGFGAAMLAASALSITILLRRAERRRGPSAPREEHARAARIAWISAALLALFASVASAIVARRSSF